MTEEKKRFFLNAGIGIGTAAGVTVVLLLLLAFLVWKTELPDGIVKALPVCIYVLACYAGGSVAAVRQKNRMMIAGGVCGILYFAVLCLVSGIAGKGHPADGVRYITTFLLCLGGGMAGGIRK